MIQLVERSVNVVIRSARPKRRDNLPVGDPDIPGSIVYAAVIRALGQLNDRNTLDFIIRAANDFDPYVRTETLEILKRIDPTGSDLRSQAAARQALNDPRDSTARLACQLVAQYQDTNAISSLQSITQTRPELAQAAHDALKRLGQ
jgi:HEAT repeat protein